MELSTRSYLALGVGGLGLVVAVAGAWLDPPGTLPLAFVVGGVSVALGGLTYAVYTDGLLPGVPREDERTARIEARASRSALGVVLVALILASLATIARPDWITPSWPIVALLWLGFVTYAGMRSWYARRM